MLVHRAGDPEAPIRRRSSAFLAAEPRLKPYAFYLHDSCAARPTRSPTPKRSCSPTPVRSPAPRRRSTASSRTPTFRTRPSRSATARAVKLDQAAFTRLRALPNRGDREKVMSAFFGALGALQPHVRRDDERRIAEGPVLSPGPQISARRSSCALDATNIPTSVYTRLVDGVNRNLPTFHRYLRLRKRMMGVDQLHYYDLYAPLVAAVNLTTRPRRRERTSWRRSLRSAPDTGRSSPAPSTIAGSTSTPPRASAPAPTRTAARTTSTRTC